jgi:hypothetical protein
VWLRPLGIRGRVCDALRPMPREHRRTCGRTCLRDRRGACPRRRRRCPRRWGADGGVEGAGRGRGAGAGLGLFRPQHGKGGHGVAEPCWPEGSVRSALHARVLVHSRWFQPTGDRQGNHPDSSNHTKHYYPSPCAQGAQSHSPIHSLAYPTPATASLLFYHIPTIITCGAS